MDMMVNRSEDEIITHDQLMENAVSWLMLTFFLVLFGVRKWFVIALLVMAILWNLSWIDELCHHHRTRRKRKQSMDYTKHIVSMLVILFLYAVSLYAIIQMK